jgi:hypothetical protein
MSLNGLEDAEKATRRIQAGSRRMNGQQARVGSRMPYAYGQEYGRHRVSGKLARAAGGAAYLRGGVDEVLSDGQRDIAEGLNKVRAPGPWVLKRLALWARRASRRRAPRLKGRLRRSVIYEVRQR